jgi:hypothetical protein
VSSFLKSSSSAVSVNLKYGRTTALFPTQRIVKPTVRSASKEILRILWYPNVHYRVYNSPPQVHILCQLNPVHIIKQYSQRSVLILSSHLRSGLHFGLLSSGFPTKIVYAFLKETTKLWTTHLRLCNLRPVTDCPKGQSRVRSYSAGDMFALTSRVELAAWLSWVVPLTRLFLRLTGNIRSDIHLSPYLQSVLKFCTNSVLIRGKKFWPTAAPIRMFSDMAFP